jgi:hypothetical protein
MGDPQGRNRGCRLLISRNRLIGDWRSPAGWGDNCTVGGFFLKKFFCTLFKKNI